MASLSWRMAAAASVSRCRCGFLALALARRVVNVGFACSVLTEAIVGLLAPATAGPLVNGLPGMALCDT